MSSFFPSGKRRGRPPGDAWNRANLVGKRFHRIMVLSDASDWVGKNGDIQARWNCICDCGKKKKILGQHLKRGMIKSCGCLSAERSGARALRHGQSRNGRTLAYRSWMAMKTRCTNPNQSSASHYVLRGIKICPRWISSFENFFADMGPRPHGYTIERIENFGNYEPGNCRWATQKEQTNNSRKNLIIKYRGISLTASQWAERLGFDSQVIYSRHHSGETKPERLLSETNLKTNKRLT